MSNISTIHIENFGKHLELDVSQPGSINFVVGKNGTGKTTFLKALYASTKAIEEYRRGNNIRSLKDILAQRLRWTFQVERLGDLVARGAGGPLSFSMEIDGKQLSYSFSSCAVSRVGQISSDVSGRQANSIFIPPRDVFAMDSIILRSREVDHSFGFDDTHYDLVRALRAPPKQGNTFSTARRILRDAIAGQVEFDENGNRWYYTGRHRIRLPISVASDGTRKLAVFERLLANGYLGDGSIVFIDEIESALDPDQADQLLRAIVSAASKADIQFFISTNRSTLPESAIAAKDGTNQITLSRFLKGELHE